MSIDPIVAEARKARDEIVKRFNYDLRAIFEDARKREAESGHRIASFPPRPAHKTASK
jgi:hypothetical protein